MRRVLLITAGCASLALGGLGILLPLLPTTPFLLLAAACFARASDRLHRWLLGHRLFGPYIFYYQRFRAISRWSRGVSLAALWGTLGYSALVVVESGWVRLVLLGVAVGVTTHLARLRTLTPEMQAELARETGRGRVGTATAPRVSPVAREPEGRGGRSPRCAARPASKLRRDRGA